MKKTLATLIFIQITFLNGNIFDDIKHAAQDVGSKIKGGIEKAGSKVIGGIEEAGDTLHKTVETLIDKINKGAISIGGQVVHSLDQLHQLGQQIANQSSQEAISSSKKAYNQKLQEEQEQLSKLNPNEAEIQKGHIFRQTFETSIENALNASKKNVSPEIFCVVAIETLAQIIQQQTEDIAAYYCWNDGTTTTPSCNLSWQAPFVNFLTKLDCGDLNNSIKGAFDKAKEQKEINQEQMASLISSAVSTKIDQKFTQQMSSQSQQALPQLFGGPDKRDSDEKKANLYSRIFEDNVQDAMEHLIPRQAGITSTVESTLEIKRAEKQNQLGPIYIDTLINLITLQGKNLAQYYCWGTTQSGEVTELPRSKLPGIPSFGINSQGISCNGSSFSKKKSFANFILTNAVTLFGEGSPSQSSQQYGALTQDDFTKIKAAFDKVTSS